MPARTPSTDRIVHVVTTLRVAGAERFAVDLAVAQQRAGRHPTIVAMYDGGPLLDVVRAAGVACVVITRQVKYDVVAWLRLVRALQRLQPDIVHLHDVAPIVRGAPAARLACRAPIVTVRHDVRSLGRVRDMLVRASGALTSTRIASSRAVAAYLERAGDHATGPVIPCGIDRGRFTYREPAIDAAPRLLTVGRLDTQKGHDVLIAAIAQLVKRWPRLTLTIAGEGPGKAALVAASQAHGVADRVRFIGIVPDSASPLATADLFCFPSRWEPQGLALIEAQASGVPVIASAVDGILETVRDETTGVLVPAGDPAALAAAIDRLADDAVLRRRLARTAHDAVAKWDVRVAVAAYAAVYREALDRDA